MAHRAAGIAVFAAALLSAGCATAPPAPTHAPLALGAANPCASLEETRHYRPQFPREAVAQQGWVAMTYHVAANGEVIDVRVVASSPEGVFEHASIAALSHSRYAAMNYPVRNCSQIDYYRLDAGPIASLR
ncbi:MAG TPA: energy transducer TonB [Nevskiaceae bacterium]|nr:energy transducer TonB [Nevskiaceae bacterium]